MHRIDNTTAVAQLPAPAPVGTPGYFTGGDLVGGVAPTIVDADWLNAIQEELISILAAGGITPNKTQKNQVLQALQAMFTSTGYVNSFGLGSHAANVPGNNIDDPTIPTGFYYVDNTTSGAKPAGDDGFGHLIVSREGANGTTARQLYLDNITGRIWTRVRVPSQWSGWSEIAFLDSPIFTGKVGIGTAPSDLLHVKSQNASTWLRIETSADGGVYVGNNGGSLQFNTASTERMSIDASGNVKIGASGNQINLNDFFTRSHAQNGYQKLPGGLILQWMFGQAGQSGTRVNNTFPIAFPSACFGAFAVHAGTADSVNIIVDNIPLPTATTIGLRSSWPSGNVQAFIIAIGN